MRLKKRKKTLLYFDYKAAHSCDVIRIGVVAKFYFTYNSKRLKLEKNHKKKKMRFNE